MEPDKPDKQDIKLEINNLYENSDFFKIYGLDFWITTIFIIVSILLTIFIYISNHFKEIRKNWDKERCNPAYLPFAGLINPQPNMTAAEYTAENFKFCNNLFIKNTEKKALGPVYQISDNLNNIANNIKKGWTSILGNINLVKNALANLVEIVLNKLVAIIIPIQVMFIKVKDSLGKMTGSLVAAIYTFYNLYKVIKLYYLNIVRIMVTEVFMVSVVEFTTLLAITIASYIGFSIAFAYGWIVMPVPIVGPALAAPPLTYAGATWSYITSSLVVSLALNLIYNIFVWTILVMLNNFSNQVFKDMNTPVIPNNPNKVKSSSIKSTSNTSLNPLNPKKRKKKKN